MPARSEYLLAQPKGQTARLDGQPTRIGAYPCRLEDKRPSLRDNQVDRWKILSLYRFSSPIGATALLSQ